MIAVWATYWTWSIHETICLRIWPPRTLVLCLRKLLERPTWSWEMLWQVSCNVFSRIFKQPCPMIRRGSFTFSLKAKFRRETCIYADFCTVIYSWVYHITTSHQMFVLYIPSFFLPTVPYLGLSQPSVKRMAGMKANMIFKLKVAKTPSSLGKRSLLPSSQHGTATIQGKVDGCEILHPLKTVVNIP